MNALPSTLRNSLTVESLPDGQVSVSVILPADLVPDYCHFLESLSSFFHSINRHSRIAQAQVKANSSSLDIEAQSHLAAYRTRLVNSFDRYASQGIPRQEIYRRICADLRAEGHPWRTLDIVRATLVEAQRGGSPGRPPKSNGDKR